jgi:intracellular sulfur oxidation DsrE/DsrF family protein
MSRQSDSPFQRRSFLTRLSAGMTAVGAAAFGKVTLARAESTATRWEPARHEKDDWLDQLPGKHRLVFDTITPEGLAQALAFTNNFMRVNRSDYGLQNSDLAVVIVVRARSTPFGYSDAIWAKYGAPIAKRAQFQDPKSKQPPKSNLYNAAGYDDLLANRGTTLDSLFKQGVQLAVCSVATRAFAGSIAEAVGAKTDDINSELIANLTNNSRMVPAGIVAVNRAQERGYSLVTS